VARLRAVPEHAERALALIRVSKDREGTISPEIQRTAIADYCAARGYEILDEVEGLDESGSRARSAWWPTLERAVAAVEAGEYDVLVTWKYSRIARQRLKWATAIERVEAAGGRIESATEQLDTSTSAGRFARGMLGELNAFYAETIGEGWKEAQSRRISSGRPASGKGRWGYTYDTAEKIHVVDPVTGPVLAELYRRYVAGESFYNLVRWLNSNGHRTQADQPWTLYKLRRVMDTGFGSGHFIVHGELHRGIHEPVIDDDLWQAYQDSRARRRTAPPRRERSQYLLSGLVRCGRCKRSMTAGVVTSSGPQYRCKSSNQSGPLSCTGGYVNAVYLEDAVFAWLQDLAEDVDRSRDAELQAKAHRTTVQHDAARLARQIQRSEEALSRLAIQHAETPLPPAVYRRAYAELNDQLIQMREAHDAAGRDHRRAVVDPAEVARGLLADWETTPVARRRQVLETLLKHVLVLSGRPPRREITIVPAWEPEGKP